MSMNTNTTPTETKATQKRKKLNVFDFLVILVVLAVIGFAIFWATPWSQSLKNKLGTTVSLQYTVEIKDVDQAFIEKIQEGNHVIDSVSKNEIGTVVAIEIHEHEILSVGENGQGIMIEAPDRYNMIVTVSSNASYQSGKGYAINGCRIAVGESMALRFPDYVCEGFCIGLTID